MGFGQTAPKTPKVVNSDILIKHALFSLNVVRVTNARLDTRVSADLKTNALRKIAHFTILRVKTDTRKLRVKRDTH